MSPRRMTVQVDKDPDSARSGREAHRHQSALPQGFDVRAWAQESCAQSGVSFAVTDPVALAKLGVLTRTGGS